MAGSAGPLISDVRRSRLEIATQIATPTAEHGAGIRWNLLPILEKKRQ
jgi:hypothetical protein